VEEGTLPPEKAGDQKKDFRGRYYFEKLQVLDPSDSPDVQRMSRMYVEGLAWCLAYYIRGCASWEWYYPYHYAPLISDVRDAVGNVHKLQFKLGKPFLPFQQLLSCLPADSAKFLPENYQQLMTSPTSEILDFYPRDFSIDMNGKRKAWEGVVLIPFIDEQRLRAAVRAHCPDSALTSEERARNQFGKFFRFTIDRKSSLSVPSCNAELYPDLAKLPLRRISYSPRHRSTTSFKPSLVPGTSLYLPGFPKVKVGCFNRSMHL
jgi:5'-3' exoribonuclease 1